MDVKRKFQPSQIEDIPENIILCDNCNAKEQEDRRNEKDRIDEINQILN